MPQTSAALNLGDLANGMPGAITPERGAAFAQAAVVCLEDQRHRSGVPMGVDGDYSRQFQVIWAPEADPAQARRAWGDLAEAAEHGAYGVAALLVKELTGLAVVERSRKGTGFDYWLGNAEDGSNLFQDRKRLEVSGILKGGEAELRSRVRRKLGQTQQSDDTRLPAIVAVVEFGTPRSQVRER